jgi:hypothetical protein
MMVIRDEQAIPRTLNNGKHMAAKEREPIFLVCTPVAPLGLHFTHSDRDLRRMQIYRRYGMNAGFACHDSLRTKGRASQQAGQ